MDNTTGGSNTFIGQGAGRLNTTGNTNTLIESLAGSIPLNSQWASLHIYNLSGQLIKNIPITTFGKGTIPLSAYNLDSGSYTYSLKVDGQLIQSKKMNLVK